MESSPAPPPEPLASEAKPARAKRWRLAGAVSLGLVAALGGAWFYRLPLSEALIKHNMSMSGVPADLSMERLDFGGATVRAIRIGTPEAPDLWVETARVDLDWGGGFPAIGAIAIERGWVRGTISESGVSFGALQKLGSGEPLRTLPKIPDWAISVSDFRFIGVTPLGRFDAAIEADGRLHDDFRANADVGPVDLNGPKGGMDGFDARLKLATVSNQLTGDLRITAKAATWRPYTDKPVTQIAAPSFTARFAAPFDLQGVSVTMESALDRATSTDDLDLRSALLKVGVKIESFEPGFKPGRMGGGYEVTAGPSLVAGARFAKLAAQGPIVSNGDGAIESAGTLTVSDGALSAEMRRTVGRAIPGLGGTPLDPLMRAGKSSLDSALAGFDLNAPVTLSWVSGSKESEGKGRLMLGGEAKLSGKNGAALTLTPAVQNALGIALPSGAVSGGFALTTKGAGLPDGTVTVSSLSIEGEKLSAQARLDVRDWRAGNAALRAENVALTLTSTRAGGRAEVRGAALLTGPFAGLRLVEAQTPLNLAAMWGGGFRVEPLGDACIAVTAAQVEAPGVTFVRAPLRACTAEGGAFVVGDERGQLSGGFVIDGLAWSGAMAGKGREPARLSTGVLTGDVSGTAENLVLDMKFAGPDFSAQYPQQRSLRARADAVTARLTTNSASWAITGVVQQMDFRDTALPAQVTKFDADWRGAPRSDGQAVFRLENGRGRLFDPADKALYHPIIARETFAVLEDGVIRAGGVLALEEKPVRLGAFVATHDVASGVGEMRANARDLVFSADLQPYDVSEMARGLIDKVRGPVDVEINANWTPTTATTGGVATIKNVDLNSSSLGPVEGLSGEVVLNDLAKMTTPPGQKLSVRTLNPGILVENGEISIQLLENQEVRIESANWPFAAGVLSVEPTTIQMAGEETRLSLTLTDVDVGALTKQLNFKDLEATGKVQGRFPLVFTKTRGRIEGGRLEAAAGGGTIAYKSAASPAGAAGLAFDALRTFRYDNLSLELDGDLDGELVSAIKFEGVNREPIDPGGSIVPIRIVGIPFKFNVTVRAPFMSLAQSASGLGDARRYIEEATAAVEGEGAPQNAKTPEAGTAPE